MNNLSLKGVGVALIVPFNKDLSIDWLGYEKLINHVIDGGVNYVVVNGTTGESATTSFEETQAQITAAVKIVNNRVPVIAGVGYNNTAEVIKDINEYDLTGVSAILSVSPYYNRPTQEGIYQHYKAIAENSKLPIILYNVPSRTAKNVEADTTLRLAKDLKNIIATKEASPDFAQFTKIAMEKTSDFLLISGSDELIFHQISLGFTGVISVAANVVPKPFCKMVNLCLEGKYDEAKQIHFDLFNFISMLFEQGNPAGSKCALKHLGICEENIRLPLVPVDAALSKKIAEHLEILSKYN